MTALLIVALASVGVSGAGACVAVGYRLGLKKGKDIESPIYEIGQAVLVKLTGENTVAWARGNIAEFYHPTDGWGNPMKKTKVRVILEDDPEKSKLRYELEDIRPVPPEPVLPKEDTFHIGPFR